jgi:hypothetical protein
VEKAFMMLAAPLIALCLTALIGLGRSQCPGFINEADGCGITPFDVPTEPIYYAPDDTMNMGIRLESSGCDSGTYGAVTLSDTNDNSYQCDCLPLDGASHVSNWYLNIQHRSK